MLFGPDGVPLRILGDIVDWVIQKFGFEKLGLGEKFEGAFGVKIQDWKKALELCLEEAV